MRYIAISLLLLLGACTSYYNPGLDTSVNRNEQFKKDREQCRERSKKETNSEPRNDYRFLKTYDSQQKELSSESRTFDRCMSGKGWIKK